MDRDPRGAVIQRTTFTNLPALVVHADWSINPKKRWLAIAELNGNHYRIYSTELVGNLSNFLKRMQKRAGAGGCVLIGFDFPIGLPYAYAQLAGITGFYNALPKFGRDEWSRFYDVAESADQISLHRPFFPKRPGGTRRKILLNKLGITSFDQLLRTCDKAPPLQRPAAPLFWTLGAQQVGKAAINGWQSVLAPGLNDPILDLTIWPFTGKLSDLLKPGRIIIAETYPAEFMYQLSLNKHQKRFSKRQQSDRIFAVGSMIKIAIDLGIEFFPQSKRNLLEGFGTLPSGEDRFDSVVGLIGMLQILCGKKQLFEPEIDSIRKIEGWIFGLVSE